MPIRWRVLSSAPLKAMPIRQAIDLRHRWANLRDAPLTFAEAEQALLVGHAFHPAPKSHEPFNETEARRYLPDFASRFPLRWFAVESELIAGESLNVSLRERLLRFAAQSAPELLGHFTDTRWLLPMHPWQAEYLLGQDWCQRLVAKGACRIWAKRARSGCPPAPPARCTAKPTAT